MVASRMATAEDAADAQPAAPEEAHLAPADWVALAIPGLIWGSSFYLIAEALDGFEPFLVTWLRVVIGCVVVMAVPASRTPVPRGTWPRLAGLAVIWMVVPLSLFPFAEQRVSSSVTGMLNGATPVFAALVATLLVRRAPPGRQLLGLAIGVLGVVLIAVPTWTNGEGEGSSAVGVVMILSALACYGISLNLAGPLQRSLGALPMIGRVLIVTSVLLAPFGLASIDASEFEWGSAAAVAVLGAFGTGVAYVVQAANAGRYGGTRSASTTYLIPGVSLLLGLLLRDESVAALAVVGSGVALAGAYLVNTAVRRPAKVAGTAAQPAAGSSGTNDVGS